MVGLCGMDQLLQWELYGCPLVGDVDNQRWQPFAGSNEGEDCLRRPFAKRYWVALAISLLRWCWDIDELSGIHRKVCMGILLCLSSYCPPHPPFCQCYPRCRRHRPFSPSSLSLISPFVPPSYLSFGCLKLQKLGLLDLLMNLTTRKPDSRHW